MMTFLFDFEKEPVNVLTFSILHYFTTARETPVKRAKNKNRPEKSFRKTLSDADWLKVRLSMVKPLPELAVSSKKIHYLIAFLQANL